MFAVGGRPTAPTGNGRTVASSEGLMRGGIPCAMLVWDGDHTVVPVVEVVMVVMVVE